MPVWAIALISVGALYLGTCIWKRPMVASQLYRGTTTTAAYFGSIPLSLFWPLVILFNRENSNKRELKRRHKVHEWADKYDPYVTKLED